MYLCGLYGPQNKQQLSPFTVSTSFIIIAIKSVYCVERTGSLYKTDYVLSVKGQANKLVTIKRRPELYSENQQVETSNSEAPFCFFTCSLTGDLNMNGLRSEWGARRVTGLRGIMVRFLEGKDETFLYSQASKMILGPTQPPIPRVRVFIPRG